MQGKVTDVLSTGYLEVAPLNAAGEPGKARVIAQESKRKRKEHAKRGDIVELQEIVAEEGRSNRVFFYIIPIALLVLGILITGSRSGPERILTGVILGIMGFVVAWILNRKARLSRRQEFEIIRVVQKAKDIIV